MTDFNTSPLMSLGKLKNKEDIVKKCESYEVFTLNNRLFSYKNISRGFILKVNAKLEDVNKLYQSMKSTDKEYLKTYCSDILVPVFQRWIATSKQKEINEFLEIINNLDKDASDTPIIIKDLYKYMVANLHPFEQKYFIIKHKVNQ